MRIAFVVIVVLHGLIHLLGFVKAFGLAEVPQLTGATTVALGPGWVRPIGALWLAAAALIVGAAVMLALGMDGWWRIGAIGLVLSQALIVYAWRDARAGTLANVVLALGVTLGWGQARFDRATDAAIARLFAGVSATPAPAVTAAEVATLPTPVARWLTRAGVIGRPAARAVRVEQRGRMRSGVGKPFAPVVAEQYYAIDEPGFVWAVRLSLKGVPIAGRDAYLGGHGRMLIAAGGLVPVVDATGPQIDQGTLLRFLGEMVWFPSAALAPYLRWQAIDDTTAEVTMTWREVSASGRFTIDGEGRVTGFAAKRYFGSGERARLEDWWVPMTAWARFDGVEVPVRGSVIWKLAAGDFDYYQWEMRALEYDRPARYER